MLSVFLFVPEAVALETPTDKQGFSTSYDVVYDIDSVGVTTVTEKITLKNLTSEYYANEFKLIIGATRIFDIKASDGSGPLQVQSEQKDTSTVIKVKFNQQVAGIGKTLPWTLQFKSKDFAQNLGKVWEVRAPKVSSAANLENYNFTISVPSEFGEPTLISPTPKSQTGSSGKLFLTFEKDQLLTSGVSANFGAVQIFDFDLSYQIENKNLTPILTNIAIPPDTEYQDVIIQRIEPKPINVTVDHDGNYLAWFRLKYGEKINVKVVGAAKIYTLSKVKNPTLDNKLRDKYTKSDKYWEKNHPQIQSKLKEILGSNPPEDSMEKARLIYRYVVNLLKYDSTRFKGENIERLGAVTALNNPTSAVCMEFTDLFIALARAAGIPARELDGFAYSSNTALRPLSLTKDFLHSWPEIWDDKRGWVMIDPTWENTTGGVDYFNKLDLNHFVFVTKGLSSEQPIPAGSYKYSGQGTNDVKVQVSENDFLGKAQLDVKIENTDPILAGFPGKIKIKLSNLGNALYQSTAFGVTSNKLIVLENENKNLGSIPPFGTATFDLNIRTKSLFDSFNDQIIVQIGSQKYTKEISVKPLILFQTAPLIGALVISFIVIIYAVVLGGKLYASKIYRKI